MDRYIPCRKSRGLVNGQLRWQQQSTAFIDTSESVKVREHSWQLNLRYHHQFGDLLSSRRSRTCSAKTPILGRWFGDLGRPSQCKLSRSPNSDPCLSQSYSLNQDHHRRAGLRASRSRRTHWQTLHSGDSRWCPFVSRGNRTGIVGAILGLSYRLRSDLTLSMKYTDSRFKHAYEDEMWTKSGASDEFRQFGLSFVTVQ